MHDWIQQFSGAITVCDAQGIILEMNDKAARAFEKDGGRELIGKNLFDCHSPASQRKLAEIMHSQQPNVYTIEKEGVKKLIYQTPWYQDGQFAGLVELSLEIPFDMPHFVRDTPNKQSELVIEKAAPEDAAEILALQKLAYQSEAELYNDYSIPPLTQTLDELSAQIEKHIFLKAVENGRIVGSVRGHVTNGTGHLERLVVHPDCQGRGIGKQLVRAIENCFGPVQRCELFTGEKSERNLHLYQKLGYRIFRRERLSEQVMFVYLEKIKGEV